MSGQRNGTGRLARNTFGGAVGNVLEWYDFAVFGYFAPIIGAHFFPAEDALASTINAFGVFAAGYMMRPIGGMLFGHLGDRAGRKRALQWSVALMAVPTTLIAALPTYAEAGLLAPILLVLLRLVQGLSVGGEYTGSIAFITEIAPPKRRGLLGSTANFSSSAGVMAGSAAAAAMHALMPAEMLAAWGWRLPFLAGLAIGAFGLWMRRGICESEAFEQAKAAGLERTSPVVGVVRAMPLRLLHVMALIMLVGGGFYMLFVWWPTYLTKMIDPPVPHALAINTIAMAVLLFTTLGGGWMSDRLGRKTVLCGSMLGVLVAAYPLFAWTDHGTFRGALMAQIVFATLMGGVCGPASAAMAELFPTRYRASGVSIGYNAALALFGGTAPMIATYLVAHTGRLIAPAFYLMLLALCSFFAAALLPRRLGGASFK